MVIHLIFSKCWESILKSNFYSLKILGNFYLKSRDWRHSFGTYRNPLPIRYTPYAIVPALFYPTSSNIARNFPISTPLPDDTYESKSHFVTPRNPSTGIRHLGNCILQ